MHQIISITWLTMKSLLIVLLFALIQLDSTLGESFESQKQDNSNAVSLKFYRLFYSVHRFSKSELDFVECCNIILMLLFLWWSRLSFRRGTTSVFFCSSIIVFLSHWIVKHFSQVQTMWRYIHSLIITKKNNCVIKSPWDLFNLLKP